MSNEIFLLDQVAQSRLEPDFECLQWWDIHNFPEQPVLVFHHNLVKDVLMSNLNLLNALNLCHSP